ncbi:hypothetical protein D3C75_845980 [compost metagenome]
MQRKTWIKHAAWGTLGLLLAAAGMILLAADKEAEGMLRALPGILTGVGCGLFGSNTGALLTRMAARKNPQLAKQQAILEKDERNISINNQAKAKAYDLMIWVFSALMLGLALSGVTWPAVCFVAACYLFVVAAHVYYLHTLHKTM